MNRAKIGARIKTKQVSNPRNTTGVHHRFNSTLDNYSAYEPSKQPAP
jgi:hypothetical protein